MMMFQYSHTEDIDDVLVFTYCRCRWWWFRISILNIEMMMLLVFTYWRCRWWWFGWWCTDEASVSSKVQTLSRQAWCGSERTSPKGGVVMLQWDCIILGHLSKSDPVTSVLENEEGLYHPGTSIQNRSGEFSIRECGDIASPLNFGSKCIQRS